MLEQKVMNVSGVKTSTQFSFKIIFVSMLLKLLNNIGIFSIFINIADSEYIHRIAYMLTLWDITTSRSNFSYLIVQIQMRMISKERDERSTILESKCLEYIYCIYLFICFDCPLEWAPLSKTHYFRNVPRNRRCSQKCHKSMSS